VEEEEDHGAVLDRARLRGGGPRAEEVGEAQAAARGEERRERADSQELTPVMGTLEELEHGLTSRRAEGGTVG
jgi:hypothetical protein